MPSSAEHTTSFAASGEDALTRPLEIRDAELAAAAARPGGDFATFYEIERTARELVAGRYRRIALQFPDELLCNSVPVFRALTQRIAELCAEEIISRSIIPSDDGNPQGSGLQQGAPVAADEGAPELYVLADTSYGSCCVDEVAAQHANADALVHYGHACMTLTSRLPVIYVFGRKEIDVPHCVAALLGAYDAETEDGGTGTYSETQAILLTHDAAYTHAADALLSALRATLAIRSSQLAVLYEKIGTSSRPAEELSKLTTQAPSTDVPAQKTAIFYVGGESLGLTNLLMTNAGCEVYTVDPHTGVAVRASARTNRLLMRRYAAVQKARDADVFGILVGTLGVAAYLPLIAHLRRALAARRKKSYTISVGRLAPAKLANFLEIECFVLVACPENSLVDDKEFLRPIVTPFELEVALQSEPRWEGTYVLDFTQLLADAQQSPPLPSGATTEEEAGADISRGDDSEQPAFSLVTGTYRHTKTFGRAERDGRGREGAEPASAVVLRNQDGALAVMEDSAAGRFLAQRTYQGLELRLGADAPGVLEQGRSGIARGYQDDRAHQDML
ncbi:hypothetical protein HYPSUDRAFT_71650 [Hypholoma sublateritium FD-334 SS-4]|uniref:2-(3-amino-3-carboxypropyl)histidine synthase subunit 2 n=1 Tax=Hypholoma sublateritium (strain FD-334 SS-4) TaxID=945553 RepID=A0A0D2P6L4_HYPSF|nr:hypothetical protein HYPSUDRAFT_71650 [Hypholoma sublateritium FD-334 SS-4]